MRYFLTGSAVTLAGASAIVPPEVPWWGQLLMALVATALAFFGGRSGARE